MKLIGLAAILAILCFEGCAVAPSDAPGDPPLLVNATLLTPGLEAVRRGVVPYPQELYSSGISGRIKVSLEINRSGEVTMAQVIESTEGRLEVASIQGALKWRFKPGPRKGDILFDFVSPNPTRTDKAEAPLKNDPGSFDGDYVLVADTDVKPRLTVAVQPAYPASAAKLKLNGSVDVAFIINIAGETTQIRAVKATDADFAASAVAAVAKWRFSPGIKNGKPVACLARQNLAFALDN